jgi:hypothetical protein
MRPRKFGDSVPKNLPLSESDWYEYEPRPATDLLAAFGVGSAVVAFLLWAWPSPWPSPWAYEWWHGFFYFGPWFPTERLPAAAAFLALSFILLLLRRR